MRGSPLRAALFRPSADDSRSACAVRAALAAVLALATGCADRSSPLDGGSRARLEQAGVWRSEIRPAPYRPDAAGAEIGDPRTAEDFVALALARNPSIRAAEARARRLAERAPQAGSLDDPMLTVAPVGEMAETAAGMVGVMTSLSQRLPLPEKLGARARIAELEAAQAGAELDQTRLRVAADTRRAYWTYAFAVRAIETTRESRALLEQLRDAADAQFRSGQRNQQDVLRAAAELGNLDAELTVLARRRATAAAMLRQLIDAPPSMPLPDPAPPGEGAVVAERDLLLVRAAEVNPALRGVAERMTRFEQQQRLANLNRWPDLTVSLTYNLVDDEGLSPVANGDDQWWVGFGVNLPIWKEKYDAAEREAIFGRLEAASELAAERNRVSFRVEDALLRLESQREVLGLLRAKVIPDARAAVESSAAAYRAGSGDFLMLIDNWRRLVGYRVMEHEVASGVEQALADLQEAVGADIDRTTGEPTAAPSVPGDAAPDAGDKETER